MELAGRWRGMAPLLLEGAVVHDRQQIPPSSLRDWSE
jgi:hypothetical protein